MEVFYREQWGLVCSDNWDMNEAMVVCRQLGYKYAVRAFEDDDYYYYWSERMVFDEVNCTGNEQNLTSCSYHVRNHHYYCRNPYSWAAVECSSTGNILIFIVCTN